MVQINPDTAYLVRQPTAHPVMENWRVRTFRQLLRPPVADASISDDDRAEQLAMLGEVMYQVGTLLLPLEVSHAAELAPCINSVTLHPA